MRYPELAFPAGWSLKVRWDSYYRLGTSFVRPAALARRMRDENDPDCGSEARRLAALLKPDSGLPGATLAWKIGQGLRKELPWSNGLVSLWLCGRYSDVVGFLATYRRLYSAHERLRRFSHYASWLRFIAPECDVEPDSKLESLYFTLSHFCTEKGLAALRLGMTYRFLDEEIRRENALERKNARIHWVLDDEEASDFDRAWSTWRETCKAQRSWPRALKLAFRLVSAPEFDALERERITIFCLKDLENTTTPGGSDRDIILDADIYEQFPVIPFENGETRSPRHQPPF